MTQNEIIAAYNLHKGEKVSFINPSTYTSFSGILAGYISGYLVARDNSMELPGNWGPDIGLGSYREDHKNGDHYFTFNSLVGAVFEPIIPITPQLLSERYVDSHFNDLDQEIRQQYIDIFIIGCNHKTK